MAAAFSPDGKNILTSGRDRIERLWDTATGLPIGKPLEFQGGVHALAFSPDGKNILTASEDRTARLWDAVTGQPISRALVHQGAVVTVAFSPDGKTVLTGSTGGTARLWDVATGQPIGKPMEHQGPDLAVVAFSPDGKTILTASVDGSEWLWEAPAHLPDNVPRLAAWVETLTGLELDEQGAIHVLEPSAWRQRRDRLEQLGGPPPAASTRLLDPILYGPDPIARVRALRELKRWTEAEEAVDEIVRARPLKQIAFIAGDSPFILDSSLASSQPERAAAYFAKALEGVPEDRSYDSPRSLLILEMARWARAYDKLLELRPNDGHLWTGRGRYYALRSRWDQAAADFAHGIKYAPPESEEWFEHACLRLIVGDKKGYRAFVREMRRREGQTNNPLVAYILARSCIQDPDPVVEPEQVIRWANQAVERDPLPWYLHALGAAYYRAGQLDEAIKWLEESNDGYSKIGIEDYKLQNRLVRAMAYQRLGHQQHARTLLGEVNGSWAQRRGLEDRRGCLVALD